MGKPRELLRRPATALVGRTDELAQIAAALTDANTTGVVLVGPGGVGKTHLARHALATAAASGFAVAEILATRSASHIPLGALEPILGRDESPGSVGALRSAQARLKEIADGWPLVLLVDDAHLLDDVSATLVLQLSRDDGVFIVATVRSGEGIPDPVTALWKDAGAERIDLDVLSIEGTEALIGRLMGGPVALPTLRRLIEMSRGLPMMVCELVDAARRSRVWRLSDGVWEIDGRLPMSDRLVDLVHARLSGSAQGERDALALVALGDPLPLRLATDLTSIEVLTALERQELVVIGADEEVSVTHPLYGEVAVAELGELRRRSLLTSLADAVEADEHSPTDVLRVAIWRLAAGGDVDAGTALRAAEAAYRAGDHATAATLAAAAWEAKPSADAGHLHGLALSRMGRADEAEAALAAATELAFDTTSHDLSPRDADLRDPADHDPDGDRIRTLVVLARTENLFRGCNDADGALALVQAAEATTSSPWRDELAGHRAMLLLNLNRIDEALAVTAPLLAEGVADRVLVRAAYAAGIASAYAGRSDDAAAIAARALPVHERIWSVDVFQTEPAVHHITAMLALVEAGDLHGAEAYSDIAVQVAAQAGESYGLGYMSLIAGLVALRRGHLARARRRLLDAVPLFRATGYIAQQRWSLAGAATAAAMCGDTDAAREYLATVDELRSRTPMLLNEHRTEEARAWIFAAEGDFTSARTTVVAAATEAAQAGARAGAAHLFHTLGRLGDPATALDALQDLGPVDGRLHELRLQHLAGVLANDGERLDAVADGFTECGADLFATEAAAGAVRAHRRCGDPRAATRSHLRADESAELCEGAATPAMIIDDAVDPLTDREREVALLAARGLSSKAIAEQLFVSRRTVDNHLQRVFAKLGVSRRADLSQALGIN